MSKKESSLDRVLGRIESLDATNLANLAQRLARERSLLETIFNTALEGILVIDERGVIHYANASSYKLVGIKESDVGSVTLWRLIPGLKNSLGLSETSEIESSVSSREIELTYPDKRFVRLYILPFREEGKEEDSDTKRFVVMISDITREKMSNAEMIESERVSSILLLAAGVAHELGNPLNSLTIHLQLMGRQLSKMERTPSVAKAEKSLGICEGEIRRLDGIIKNFLEAIRPREPDFQVVNLQELIEEVLEFQFDEMSGRGISVEVEVKCGPPIVRADRNQIKQVFFNVLKNAAEAMKSGGSIRVVLSADEERFYMRFGDSGVGIKQEDLPKVFEPYRTTKQKGSGLGLMIVQRIMRDHGGQVGIDSEVGVGTVVTLEFPKQDRKFRMLEAG